MADDKLETRNSKLETGPRSDVRVDRIGFVGELVKNYIEGPKGVKAQVKSQMSADGSGTVEGQYFVGRLDPSTEREIPVGSLLRLYEEKAITRAQLCEMLTAKVAVAAEVLDQTTFRRICRSSPGTPRLVVERKGGVQIELKDALVGLHRAIVADAVGSGTVQRAEGRRRPAA